MKALRYIQEVTSDSLVIKDMGKYLGKNVEIIILPLDTETEHKKPENVKRVRGFLHKYANPALIDQETSAWQNAVKEKHVTR
jgi:hypothetical protein